jgi:hypothetical protein
MAVKRSGAKTEVKHIRCKNKREIIYLPVLTLDRGMGGAQSRIFSILAAKSRHSENRVVYLPMR